MSDLEWQGMLPTWALVLCALIVPLLLAFAFFTAMDYANQPTPGPMRPGEGQQIADTNKAIVLVHALAQLGFIIFGAWLLPRTVLGRIVFIVITIPYCAVVLFLSFFGVMAK